MSENPNTPSSDPSGSGTTQEGPTLPPKAKSSARTIWIVLAAVVAVAVAAWLVFANIGDDTTDDAADDTNEETPTDDDDEGADPDADDGDEGEPAERVAVRIGTTDISQPHWALLSDLAAAEGIDIEWVGFSEYTQPNPALSEGSLELNSFQHLQYLAQHNVGADDDLQPIGPTLIVPLPLYSEQYDDVSEFQPGDRVAIPNDVTNQARALFVLESAGLVAFAGEPVAPTPDDLDADASIVEVVPVEASQTAGLINELAGVVVNNNFANDAGFDLTSYVAADDPASPGAQPYINIFAARAADVDNPVYLRIAELYHTPEVAAAALDASGGTAVIIDSYTGPELRDILATIEENIRAAG